MEIASRTYSSSEDFPSVMTFLREVFNETGSHQNWFPDRFENSHKSGGSVRWVDDIRIWENNLLDSRAQNWPNSVILINLRALYEEAQEAFQ